MTRDKALENYYFYTGKASDIVGQLGLAAIAVVWVFKVDRAGQPTIPRALFIAAGWAILTLAIDALQYLYGAAAWGIFHRIKERAGQDQPIFGAGTIKLGDDTLLLGQGRDCDCNVYLSPVVSDKARSGGLERVHKAVGQ